MVWYYLAGKVGGNKSLLRDAGGDFGVEFVATDFEKQLDHSQALRDWGAFDQRNGDGQISEAAGVALALKYAPACWGLVAYLDTPDAYGTIAEIAWFAARSIPCLVLIESDWVEVKHGHGERAMCDAYWFVCTLPFVSRQVVESHNEALVRLDEFVAETIPAACQSPIEHAFFRECWRRKIRLAPQFHIGKYRADFAVVDKRVAIELDGHHFHKTRDQRTKDAKRERFLEREGWRVIRYTGTEVHKSVVSCVNELEEMLDPEPQSATQGAIDG